ncbi:MAG: VWA domain-containing protein [Methanoregula sp.]|nr:VWA domain-containing protein [Methanoregula sp.]
MRVKVDIFVIISLLLLAGTATAHLPDTSTIVTSNSWVVANGINQIKITVTALNETSAPGPASAPVKDALVLFSVNNPVYGNVSPSTDTTDDAGVAESTFTVNKTSGVVNITARIIADGYTVTRSINLNIDHDTPYYSYFVHPLSGTVATEVPFNISITDRWGNRIDNRTGAHIISLHVHGPAPDDCNFVGGGHDISRALDPNGNLSLKVKLTSKIGPNNILMDTFGSIPDKLEWIDADNTGIPFSMDQVFSPSGSPPTLPADGESYFTILYTLYDKYGNPTNGQWIWVNTSVPGEESQFESNNMGQITVQYGPRSSIGVIQITATSIVNSSVNLSQTVEFMNTGAAIISLTANPDAMASNDVPPSTAVSNIIATVADSSGNAVPGESVTFAIDNITYDGTYNVTADPVLLSSSGITDVYGRAAVQFRPGAFTLSGNPGYNATATGHCNVIATWNSTQKIVPVTWKNYPYLSVSTLVTPLTVGVNQTIDITIRFKGDGWAMQATPIDVVMVIDKSGSMTNYNIGGITRLQATKNAAYTFIDKLSESTDRIGLVSYDQESTVTTDASLGSSFSDVRNKINAITTNNGPTAMRQGFKQAIDHLIANGNPTSVLAVVLMTDGNWNQGGSPLAVGKGYDLNTWVRDNREVGISSKYYGFSPYATDFEDEDYRWYSGLGGSYSSTSKKVVKTPTKIDPASGILTAARTYENRATNGTYCADGQFTQQNMSIYAKNNNIRLYTLSFATTIPTSERAALITLANSTGGFYRHAPTQADLETVYAEIASDLKDTAGVNTSMVADFENINITGESMPGNQVYDYVYHSTYSTKINWQNGTTTVPAIDQSADWAADNKLDFTIGTVKVGQIWQATFRLKVKQSGLIDIFGNHSTVSFNGGLETLRLPQTFITVVPQLNITEITAKTIALDNLKITEPGEITTFLPVMWNTSYTGNKTITEKVYYSIDNGQWVQFAELTHNYPYAPDFIAATKYVDYAQLDTRNLPPGGYKIKVYATSPDAPDAMAETDYKAVGGRGRVFIKLEAPPFDFFEQTHASILPRYLFQNAGNLRGILPNLSATVPPYQ